MKENIKLVVVVLVALVIWEMLVKKFVLKSEFDEEFEQE